MNRRWLQNLCLIGIFIVAFVAVVAVGMAQGKKENSVEFSGEPLKEKIPWEEAVKQDPAQEKLPTLAEDDIVYTTPTGEKYHLYNDCSSLSHSKTVYGNTFGEIKETGKGLCTFCKNRYNAE